MPQQRRYSIFDHFYFIKILSTYAYARFAQIDTQAIRILSVVSHKLLQISESCPPSNEETSFIELSYPVVFDSVAISY